VRMSRGATLLFALSAILVSPAAALAEDQAAEITGNRVRLRSGPGTTHAILDELNAGDLVVVAGAEGRWRKVRVPGGFPCWVHASLLRRDPDGTAVVTATRVLMRPTAGKEHPPLATRLERGDVLSVRGAEGEWVEVLAPERAHAWIFEELVRDLGPAAEYRAALERARKARSERLLEGRADAREAAAKEKRRKEFRELVLKTGREVLAGEGDAAAQQRDLRKVALESDDDLTRGYANALLALVSLRREVDGVREALSRAEHEKSEAVAGLRKELEAAETKYRDALEKAQVLRTLRENPFRAAGTIRKRDERFALVEDGRILFFLESKRFDLSDYVGRRVGVNGRMVVSDPSTGETHLMVEKLEILRVEPDDR